MLYPVLPVYLKHIGFTVLAIGIIEGIAEAIAGLSKGYFGNLSDATGKRVPFVRFGYMISALAKPAIGLFANVWFVLLSRASDKLGKGIRTAARDAMLSDESIPGDRGKVFGFHRGMDTLGAVIGPTIALLYLMYRPGDYIGIFLMALIPGIITVFATFLLKEKPKDVGVKTRPGFIDFFKYFKTGPVEYKKLVTVLLIFTIVNSSDVFLLLRLKELGVSDNSLIGFYIFYNLIFALVSLPVGYLADRIGVGKMLGIGMLFFAATYYGFSGNLSTESYFLLFILYGIYAAAADGMAKALITKICSPSETATAIGAYSAMQSLFTMMASIIAGIVWYKLGPEVVFIYAAVVSAFTGAWLLTKKL
jgi:MFS family permease